MTRRRLLLGFSIATLLAIVFRAAWLTAVARLMTADDPVRPSHFVLALYDGPDAPETVLRLYQERAAPSVLVPRMRLDRLEGLGIVPARHERWRARLERGGIPAPAIRLLGTDLETDRDIGRAMASEMGDRAVRVIAITNAPPSRLRRDDLARGLAGSRVTLTMHVIRKGIHESNWWQSREGWIAYFDAYTLSGLRLLRRSSSAAGR